MPDTNPALREHVRELLKEGPLTGFPEQLLTHVAKGDPRIFHLPVVREFERMRILVDQPIAIHLTFAKGEKRKARKLRNRLVRWRVQFEEKYKEPSKTGANLEVLERHNARLCALSRS